MILRNRAEEIVELSKKAEHEVIASNQFFSGDIYIGTGETESIRLLARTAEEMHTEYPNIHYHISSGNAEFVTDQLDKGLIDFGIVVGPVDESKYDYLKLPSTEIWGVLMKTDSPLAKKKAILPKDLWDKPLIISHQGDSKKLLPALLKKEEADLNIVATYNLLFNASLFVEEGFGYAICFDKIIRTSENGPLCFRPLKPTMEMNISIIWKKYQVFSKVSQKFLESLKGSFDL